MFIKKNIFLLILTIIFCIYIFVDQFLLTPRIAYVETAKLMIGFSEAAKVEKELKVENDKWQSELKVLKDSLSSHINVMSKEYDNASSERKKELQDILSASNQRVNNFKKANVNKMEKLHAEKMKSVIGKVNVYIQEYGRKKRYGIILGTVQGGSILYGNSSRYDITEDIIMGLNERYK